jgi:hypothetical protein
MTDYWFKADIHFLCPACRNAGRQRGSANSIQGELGEVAFMHKATSLGFPLALPYGHLHRYDFIVEGGKNLWRVQVKTSSFMKRGLIS